MSSEEKQQIEFKIRELRQRKEIISGTPCEVYSRVVGYLRPVQNWNKGKKEEFKMRKVTRICGCN